MISYPPKEIAVCSEIVKHPFVADKIETLLGSCYRDIEFSVNLYIQLIAVIVIIIPLRGNPISLF